MLPLAPIGDDQSPAVTVLLPGSLPCAALEPRLWDICDKQGNPVRHPGGKFQRGVPQARLHSGGHIYMAVCAPPRFQPRTRTSLLCPG